MEIKPSDKALARDLGFRILEGEFGNRDERKELLGEYYEEAQGVANLLVLAHDYPRISKKTEKLQKKAFEYGAVIWKLGRNPFALVEKLTKKDRDTWSDYLEVWERRTL